MPTTKPAGKVACLNPATGGRINIDADTYGLFSKAIYHSLMGNKRLTFTQMVEGVQNCFQQQSTTFSGSVSWYTVTVKNDMQAKGIISVFTEKGKKLHRLAAEEGAVVVKTKGVLKSRHET
jgi:hypothetical protein